MFGVRLMILLALMGGAIAYIGDKLGSKIGKKRLTIFGLRPHDTSVLLTILSGVLISLFSVGILAISSQSARTALFGMEKLQKDMKQINLEKKSAEAEYYRAKELLEKRNASIKELDGKIKEAEENEQKAEASREAAEHDLAAAKEQYNQMQGALASAKNEVASLTEARDKLSGEIKELQEQTDHLKTGLVVMKQGDVLYRAGEVVFAGVLQGGRGEEESQAQARWLMEGTNTAAAERLGIEDPSKAEVTWVQKEEYEKLIEVLNNEKANILVRVRARANTVAGEPVLCALEMIRNDVVYTDGQLILRKIINVEDKNRPLNQAFSEFLQEVNQTTVKAGVLPDPVSGKVGNMSAVTMVETVKKMKKSGGQVILSAYADGDITTAGPVHLRMEVEKVATGR